MQETSTIVIICDNIEAGRIWAYTLSQRGWRGVVVESIQAATSQLEKGGYDLLIIDLDDLSASTWTSIHQIRAEIVIPLLLLLPTNNESDLLQAYNTGVDECMVKPVSPVLLLTKAQAWLRRSWSVPTHSLEVLQVGDLQLDPVRRQLITESGGAVRLTNLEFRVLRLLMSHVNQTLATNIIVDRVWGFSGTGDSTVLKNVIYRLRQKIEPDPASPRYIHTEAGEGYSFQT